MKKVSAFFFCCLLSLALSAAEEKGLLRHVPADTALVFGADVAALCRHPSFRNILTDNMLSDTLGKKAGHASGLDIKTIRYVLITSSDPLARSVNILIQTPNAAEIQAALKKDKDIAQVQYGPLAVCRVPGGVEFASPDKNMILFSTSSLKAFQEAEKGLPAGLAKLFEKDGTRFAAAGLIPSEELKNTNPAAAGLKSITCTLDPASGTSSDLIFRADAECTDAAAAKRSMMLAQQLQLLAGVFINNLDPDLAQDFNKNASVKTEGNNVRLQFLITEKLIQKLSVLAEPGVLKSLMADDPDF